MEVALIVVLYIWLESDAGAAYTGESSLADMTLSMFYDRQNQLAYCAYAYCIASMSLYLLLLRPLMRNIFKHNPSQL